MSQSKKTIVSVRQVARRLLVPGILGQAMVGLVLPGCGSSFSPISTFEVKGKVFLPNGKALTNGKVTFVAADGLLPQASGDLGPDGAFSLTTRMPGDGAAPGNYKVRIEPAESESKGRKKAGRPDFPVKYVDEDSSGLTATVQAQPNQLDPITLK